jgi:hypothetical protein
VETSSDVMDAHEYHGQNGGDVLRDIATQSGFNFFLRYRESSNDIEMVFRNDQTSGAEDVSATFSISNALADTSESGPIWYTNPDAEGDQIPDRVASGYQVSYEGGGDVYATDSAIATAFASIDLVAPSRFIKNAPTALAYAEDLLERFDTEEEYIRNVWVEKLPAANLNDVKVGQLITAKFTHGPGWESFRYCRVVRKLFARPQNTAEEFWRLGLELQPPGPLADGFGAHVSNVRLYGPNDNNKPVGNNGTFLINWDSNGDGVGSTPGGCGPSDQAGLLDYLGPSEEWTGVQSTGWGTITVTSRGSFSGATLGGPVTLTARLLKNGAAVATTSTVILLSGAVQWEWLMSDISVSVVPGDELQTNVTVAGMGGGDPLVIPAGTGDCIEMLWARGTLVGVL